METSIDLAGIARQRATLATVSPALRHHLMPRNAKDGNFNSFIDNEGNFNSFINPVR